MFTDRRLEKKNVVCTNNGILSALKQKEILSQANTWMNLEDIMPSEINQSQKDKHCIVLHISSSQIQRNRKQNSGYQGPREEGQRKLLSNGHISDLQSENVLGDLSHNSTNIPNAIELYILKRLRFFKPVSVIFCAFYHLKKTHILYDSIYMDCPNRQIYRYRNQINSCLGQGRWEVNGDGCTALSILKTVEM